MKPWTPKEFEDFKRQVCDINICADCSECGRSEQEILNCFDDLTAE